MGIIAKYRQPLVFIFILFCIYMYVFMYRALKAHVPYIIIVFINKLSFVNIAALITVT